MSASAAPLSQTLTLGAAGLTALAVGLAILLSPQAFYAGQGISLAPFAGPALLSELRAPAAALAALGAAILAGALRPRLAHSAAALGALVFLAFASGRLLGLALDGAPGAGILAALAVELALGGLCLRLALRGERAAPPAPI